MIEVALHVEAQAVIFTAERRVVARTGRTPLRAWLAQRGIKGHYTEGRLRLKYSDMGIWFEIEGHTAPTILMPTSVKRILELLQAVQPPVEGARP